jgi:hypothetical protein
MSTKLTNFTKGQRPKGILVKTMGWGVGGGEGGTIAALKKFLPDCANLHLRQISPVNPKITISR